MCVVQVLRKELRESENREMILTKKLEGQDKEKERYMYIGTCTFTCIVCVCIPTL